MANFDAVNDKMEGIAGATHVEITVENALSIDEALDSIEETKIGKFVWLVAICASIGGSLFGYDTGIISAVLVYLGDDLGHIMNAGEKEAITSLCSGGAFFGAIIAGLTADKYGRKAGIYAGCFLFTIGALLQATAFSLAQMCVGRLVVGLGVGSAAMIVPLYICEIAPRRFRGRMIGLNNMSITGGQVISYGIGAAFAHVPHGWRYMVGIGGVPSIALAIMLPFCPESPRQLLARGKKAEAEVVLRRIFGNASDGQIENKIRLIHTAVETSHAIEHSQTRWQKIKALHTVPSNFRALIAACGLMGMTFFRCHCI